MRSIRGGGTPASAEEALRRQFERCLLAVLVGAIVWAFLDKARDMRAAAELGAFRYSLAALRVATVLDQMHAKVAGGDGAVHNPFLLLERKPLDYAGELRLAEAEAGAIAPGNWFFDGICSCVGYRPRDDSRLMVPSGRRVMVFHLSPTELLAAREPYQWRGEAIR